MRQQINIAFFRRFSYYFRLHFYYDLFCFALFERRMITSHHFPIFPFLPHFHQISLQKATHFGLCLRFPRWKRRRRRETKIRHISLISLSYSDICYIHGLYPSQSVSQPLRELLRFVLVIIFAAQLSIMLYLPFACCEIIHCLLVFFRFVHVPFAWHRLTSRSLLHCKMLISLFYFFPPFASHRWHSVIRNPYDFCYICVHKIRAISFTNRMIMQW